MSRRSFETYGVGVGVGVGVGWTVKSKPRDVPASFSTFIEYRPGVTTGIVKVIFFPSDEAAVSILRPFI